MEVGCSGMWVAGTADPKPKQPEHPRAHPIFNPATSPACREKTQPQSLPLAPVTLNWKNTGEPTG